MYPRTIKYEDYDGNQREEVFYFNLNKAEIISWLTTEGDYTLDKKLERLYRERNGLKIMEILEDFIKRSYGEKSLDGRRFVKTPEVWDNFRQTEAYSVLFTEMVTDSNAAANFINNVIPKELAEEIAKIAAENPDGIPAEMKDYLPSK